jgi:hypothetical protein
MDEARRRFKKNGRILVKGMFKVESCKCRSWFSKWPTKILQ